MAEATGLRNNALNYPIYGAPFGIVFPITEADGDLVTAAAALDSEVSLNGDTKADCTNEATEIATSSGMYYLLLTAAEMTADVVTGITKTSTADAKTTSWSLYPRKLVTVRSGTSAGGDTAYITLDAGASAVDDYYNGMVCIATIDSGVEVRVIADYTGSNQRAAVTPAWNVAPDADDTFVIKLPEGVQIPTVDVTLWKGAAAAAMTGDAYAIVNHADYGNAKLVRSTTPANTLTVDANHLVAVPDAQKVDVNTIKTKAVTVDAGGTTFPASVGTSTLTGTAQTGDAYAIVAHVDYGNAKLVRSTTPANTLTVDVNHLVAVPATQKVDLETIKTQAVTAAAPVTVPASIGTSTLTGTVQSADVATLITTVGAAGAGLTAIPKTGYKLASDGLDSISTTAPAGVAANFREMVVQTWRRFFHKATMTATQIKTYDDAGTGTLTTQTVSDDGTTQTQGRAT